MTATSTYICIICKQRFGTSDQAKTTPCGPGGGHILQEMINGSWNDELRESADFAAADTNDLRKWGEQAKKLGFTND